MVVVASFFRLAKQLFFVMAVALILFWLPIEVLFRLSSWVLSFFALDIVKEVAMMILLLALVSASLALLVAGIGCALVGFPFRKASEKVEKTVCALITIGTMAILSLFFLRLLKDWLGFVTGFTFTVGTARPIIVLIVIGIFLVLSRKYGFLAMGGAIQSRLARGNKIVLILIASAGLVVMINGISLHDFQEVKTNSTRLPRTGMPNVILLSIDTLTAEDMSLYGYQLTTTPKLEAFARESYVFDNFFSSSNWTAPSVTSFISGLYPISSGAYNGPLLENDDKKNLGQKLKDYGYQTVAIGTNDWAHPLTLNISDSFSATTELMVRSVFVTDTFLNVLLRLKDYRTYRWVNQLLYPVFQILLSFSDDERSLWPPELAFNRALAFFNTLQQPYFIWSHILPPHSPYLPAAPFKYTLLNSDKFTKLIDFQSYGAYYSVNQQTQVDQLRLRYDEFILDTDSRVGVFLDQMKISGRFDDSIIIITADHGESFAKNVLGHGGQYLHQPLIHIPLLIHLPGQTEGRRIPFYAGHVDLLPTVMDLLELPIPKWVEGESLKPAMLEGKPTSLAKFSMNLDQDSRFAPPSKGTVAVMQDGWKLVRYLATGKEELYHLASDPIEAIDLASGNPAQARKMRDLIYARFKLAK